MSTPKTITCVLVVALSWGFLATAVHAQAWVGEGGGLSVAADYTFAPSDRVIEDEGISVDGDVSNHTVTLSSEYTPIERLAVNVNVPILTTKYTADPNAGFAAHGRYDDGTYHTVLQDMRVNARYMALTAPVAATPHIGFSMPMTNYETVGFAGAGRGLKMLHMGLSVGKYFTAEEALPNFYFQAQYEFSLVERYKTGFEDTEKFGQNRSDVTALIGYFITDNFDVNVGMNMRKAHGGFEFLNYAEESTISQIYHDSLLKEDFLLAGLGASYQVTEDLRLGMNFRYWLSGRNTRDASFLGVNASYDIL